MATSGNDSGSVPKSFARIEKYRSLLGRNPDAEVADGIGVPVEDVKAYRRRYNIPAFLRPAPGVAPPPVVTRPGSAPTAPAPAPQPPSVLRRRVGDDGVSETVLRTPPPAVTTPPAPPPEPAVPAVPEPAPSEPTVSPLERFRDQLGKTPDLAIAKQAGVSRHDVGDYRRSLGIAAYTGHLLTGARPGGGSEGPAAPKSPARTRMGESAEAQKPAPVSPVEAFRDLLGTVPDEVVAQRAGVERTTVGDYRRRLGIAAYTGHRGQGAATRRQAGERAPDVAAPATVSTPNVIAERADVAQDPRFRTSKLDGFMHLVGRESDAAVAKLAGVTAGGVRAYRHRHGIPTPPEAAVVAPTVEVRETDAAVVAPTLQEPVTATVVEKVVEPAPIVAPSEAMPAEAPTRRGPGRPSKVEAFRHLVGVLSDEEVAKLAGTAPKRVELFRQRHGIAPGEQAEPVTAAPPATVAEVAPPADAAERGVAPLVAPAVAAVTAPVSVAVAAPEVATVAELRSAEAPEDSARVEARVSPVGDVDVRVAPPVGVEPEPEPPTAAPVAPLQAFRVVAEAKGERWRFVVVGENIGVAAAAALRSLGERSDGPWTIRSVSALYELLG